MAVDFYTQNFCSGYTSKFYEGGKLSKKKIEEYGKKFGIKPEDLKGTESPADLAKILYDKQLKISFNGTDPIKNNKQTTNNNNEMEYKGQKLNIIG